MGHGVGEGVVADLAHLDGYAGQLGAVHLDAADLVPGQVLAHRNRHEAALARDLAQHPLAVVLVEFDDLRQCIPHPPRSEEHTSELKTLMRNSDAACCVKK